jgi:hypothetical protein
MDVTPQHKVEGKYIKLAKHADMFSPISEVMKWKDTDIPCPSHASLYRTWRDVAEDELDEMLKACEINFSHREQVSLDIVKEIAFHAFEEFLEVAGGRKSSIEDRVTRMDAALARPQIPQRTPAWYEQSRHVLTASEFSTLYGSQRAIGQLALAKGSPAAPTSNRPKAAPSATLSPFEWGVRFEPVVKQYLAKIWGCTIKEAGRIIHATDPTVAASPDGFIGSASVSESDRVGRLVEIKCPFTRVITDMIPFDYWCQMQIQMEVTDIDECEYVEVKFESQPVSLTDAPALMEGNLWLLENDEGELSYAYTEEERDVSGCRVREEIPWKAVQMYTKTVHRDRNWYASTKDQRDSFWKLVSSAQQGTYELPASKRTPSKPKLQVCLIKED